MLFFSIINYLVQASNPIVKEGLQYHYDMQKALSPSNTANITAYHI